MTNSYNILAQTMIGAVETEMRHLLNAHGSVPAEFDGMMQYHMGWTDDQLQPLPAKAGKRVRPLLLLLSCQAAGGNWQQAVPAAAAVELLHNFTLIHDDIQDDSPTRRGRPTVWKIWGVPQAINVGDAMFAISHLAICRLAELHVPASTVVQSLCRFDQTCLHLTQGQHADMKFENREQVTVEEYLAMITGKTAALLGLCAELGALVADKEPEIVHHYAQFALHVGLAFQIRDDILGIWGDEQATGKSAATDIITKKKTLPVLYGLAHSPQLQALYATRSAGGTFVQEAIQLLDGVGARVYAERIESDYTNKALSHLQAMGLETGESAGTPLHQLTYQLLGRTT